MKSKGSLPGWGGHQRGPPTPAARGLRSQGPRARPAGMLPQASAHPTMGPPPPAAGLRGAEASPWPSPASQRRECPSHPWLPGKPLIVPHLSVHISPPPAPCGFTQHSKTCVCVCVCVCVKSCGVAEESATTWRLNNSNKSHIT